jgi:pimeloyl-ACP methyl ester carboxylesterase
VFVRPDRALIVLAALLVPALSTGQSASSIDGVWCGVASKAPEAGPPVGVRLKLRANGDSVHAALSLPESRLIDLAIPSPYSDSASATYRNAELRIEYTPDIGLGFIGKLGVARDAERIAFRGSVRGDELRGNLRITTYESLVTLRRDRCASTFREPEIFFTSTTDSLRLGGKLVLPEGGGPFPAVVFITGSDPDTREAWQVEARALAARGVASLLYDKRGVGASTGANHDLASWDDLAGDVEGALRYLRSRGDLIDARRIGLVGQSQGTWIITKVASGDPDLAFLVNISGSGMSAAEQETYRTGALMKSDGFSEADIAAARAFQRQKFAVARSGLGWERLDSTMQRLRADSVRWFPGYGTGAATRTLAGLRLYGVLQFNYDPTRDLERITIPTLVIMGERDVVFPPTTVIERMTAALGRAGNNQVTTRIIPEASHGQMVIQRSGGQPFRRVISQEFISTLTDWIVQQSRAR